MTNSEPAAPDRRNPRLLQSVNQELEFSLKGTALYWQASFGEGIHGSTGHILPWYSQNSSRMGAYCLQLNYSGDQKSQNNSTPRSLGTQCVSDNTESQIILQSYTNQTGVVKVQTQTDTHANGIEQRRQKQTYKTKTKTKTCKVQLSKRMNIIKDTLSLMPLKHFPSLWTHLSHCSCHLLSRWWKHLFCECL